jgi:hypothetical protein
VLDLGQNSEVVHDQKAVTLNHEPAPASSGQRPLQSTATPIVVAHHPSKPMSTTSKNWISG